MFEDDLVSLEGLVFGIIRAWIALASVVHVLFWVDSIVYFSDTGTFRLLLEGYCIGDACLETPLAKR